MAVMTSPRFRPYDSGQLDAHISDAIGETRTSAMRAFLRVTAEEAVRRFRSSTHSYRLSLLRELKEPKYKGDVMARARLQGQVDATYAFDRIARNIVVEEIVNYAVMNIPAVAKRHSVLS